MREQEWGPPKESMLARHKPQGFITSSGKWHLIAFIRFYWLLGAAYTQKEEIT